MQNRFVYLALSFLIVFLSGCGAGSKGRIDTGSEAPQFTLASNLGRDVRLMDYRGKIVIIDFWATWCPPCRKGIPDLINIQNEFKNDLIVIGVCTDKNGKEDLPEFIRSQGINYPIAFSTDEVENAYGGISAVPTTFIIDRHGTIIESHVGLVEKNALSNTIKSLL